MPLPLTGLLAGLAIGFVLGWKAHKTFVQKSLSASRSIRRRAIGGRKR